NVPSGTTVTNFFSNGVSDSILSKNVNSVRTLAQSFILYRFTLYLGFFTDFVYSERADNPRIYDYNFDFTVTFNSTDFFTKSLLSNFPDASRIGLAASSALTIGN